MKPLTQQLRSCVMDAAVERGLTLDEYRSTRAYDRLLDTVERSHATQPRGVAALALSMLCDDTSASLDAVGILAIVRFLDQTLPEHTERDPNRVERISEMVGIIPGTKAGFQAWIDKWYG